MNGRRDFSFHAGPAHLLLFCCWLTTFCLQVREFGQPATKKDTASARASNTLLWGLCALSDGVHCGCVHCELNEQSIAHSAPHQTGACVFLCTSWAPLPARWRCFDVSCAQGQCKYICLGYSLCYNTDHVCCVCLSAQCGLVGPPVGPGAAISCISGGRAHAHQGPPTSTEV